MVYIDLGKKIEKNVNLVFNRSTNDMAAGDTSTSLWEQFSMHDLEEYIQQVPDKDPSNIEEYYRCLKPVERDLKELIDMVKVPYDGRSSSLSFRLMNIGVQMPAVICEETGHVINGKYRVMAMSEFKKKLKNKYTPGVYPTITISKAEEQVAEILLNMISMKFTLEKQYADQLRYGAFRRPENITLDIGPTFRLWAAEKKHKAMASDVLGENAPRFWNSFRQVYGESVMDYGAGQRRNGVILRQKGIRCTDWEPYPVDHTGEYDTQKITPSLILARHLTDGLLCDIAGASAGIRSS